jgi:Zn-dependent peptidase ImmA (M78 family)
LSKKLLENSCNKDGSFIGDSLKKLRWVTAHELGHALLHSEDIKQGDTHGSIKLHGDAEKEADSFAAELLRLRHERNEAMYKSGAL